MNLPKMLKTSIKMAHNFQKLGTLTFLQQNGSGFIEVGHEDIYWDLERVQNIRMGTDLITLRVVDVNNNVTNVVDQIVALAFDGFLYRIGARHESVPTYNYYRFHVNQTGQPYV